MSPAAAKDRTSRARAAVYVPVGQLKPWPGNPRLNEKAIAPVKDAIERFGFGAPIVARKANKQVIAGHTRLLAAKALGLKKVPVRFMDVSPAEAHLMALADNRLGEIAGWDDDALHKLLEKTPKPDAALAGWSTKDLAALARSQTPIVEDPIPDAPKNPVSKPGDLWLLGDHRLVCGDCREYAALAFGDELAHLVFTDPPYGVDYDGGTKPQAKLQGDETTLLYGVACELARDWSDSKAPLYLWHAGVWGIAAAAAAAAAGWVIRAELVWNKNQAQFGALTAQYKQKHEPSYYCHKKGKTPRWFGPTNEVTVWDIDRAPVNDLHPTQKPVALAARAIGNSSEPGQIVADFFLGAGSTLIAAEQLKRRCYGIELDPGYCDVTIERWEALTGGKATRGRS